MQIAENRGPAAVVLALVAATILLAGSAALPLLDRDEPRFAHATVEMIQRGDWVVPYFNDEYRFDKPPLTYWLMAGGYAALGFGELGARLHAILSAIGMTVVLFLFGCRVVGPGRAFTAAFAWATCVQVFLHGRLAVADMPLVLAVTVMHWALWELIVENGGGRWRLALWLAAALGFLAKGPIAIAVPAVTLLTLRLLGGRASVPWRRLGTAWGLPLALALVGAWGIPALLRTGGRFWDVGIGEHVVRRGFAAFNDRAIVPGYYLITVLLSLFPWSPNLGQLFVVVRRHWQEPRTRFLLGWALGPFLIFSFYSTQLPHYTLPAFPALLLLLFLAGTSPREFPRASRVFYWGLHGLVAATLLLLIGYAKWLDVPAQLRDLKVSAAALAGALLALQGAAILLAREDHNEQRRWLPAGALVLAGAVATGLVATTIRPLAAPIRLLPYYARVTPDSLHVAMGYTEPSLIVYSDTFWRLNVPPTREEVEAPGLFVYRGSEWGLDRLFAPAAHALRREAIAHCGVVASGMSQSRIPASRSTVDERAQRAGVPRFIIESDMPRAVVCGFNFGRAQWTELVVFYREPTPPPPGRR